VPLIVGSEVADGAPVVVVAVTVAVGALSALTEATEFVAYTLARMVEPTSAATSV
jgi:hypothetical protein